jgi:UDP-glucose 4-epimerase
MKALVTGASGFVGLRLVGLLEKKGYKVKTLSRRANLRSESVVCDLELDEIPEKSLSGVDVVYHLAGFTHDLRGVSKTLNLYQKINVDASIKLADLAVKSKVRKFIFISSVKAGGLPIFGQSASEESISEPDGSYGKTKREAELKLLEIGQNSNMHVSIIRPSLVYGPKIKGNLELMLSGIKRGWFPPLPETGNQRSMIHVDDLVRAILLVAEDKRANGEIFIATDGVTYSSREIYNVMCSKLDKSIPKWSVPKFLFDMASLVSPRIKYKFNKLLGDECYSSAKLEALGFKAQKTLKDMNETDF